ncbi:hypothetical protein CHS0354_041580 [Potamilus streckersoni]|uniref:BZIP domain-containing protein n=1 Tax=Potamilus streckersoni TaxID=2493646 RepID=A0AAE0SGL7_9BIVA|nr:hypothetical protein CHS0354_041580 [Potamilus streckersoni]
MADAALDLSSKPLAEMPPHTVKSKSPTASSSVGMHRSNSMSPSSDGEYGESSSNIKPASVAIPTSSFDSSSSGENVDDSSSLSPKPGGSSKPFEMYPMDTFSMFSSSSPLLVAPSTLSPAATAMNTGMSLFDGASSSFPTFPLTPLTSHLLQRKRRAENRSAVSQEVESLSSKKTKPIAEDRKDDAYWERRRKNNEAAKRSRDTRRQKEEEIALRAAFLEQENLKLRAQVTILKNETAKLHFMLYNRL